MSDDNTGDRSAESLRYAPSSFLSARVDTNTYELILSSLSEGIYGIDLEGRITYLNPSAARILGYSREETIGRRQHDLVHHSHADGTPYASTECPILSTLRQGTMAQVSAEAGEVFWRKDGSSFPVAYVSAPIRLEGAVVGAAVIFSDATRALRQEAEQEVSRRELAAREKLASLGTLVAGLSHEFRTPLTIIQNNVVLAEHKLKKAAGTESGAAPGLQPHLDEISAAVDRINAMVKELRRFSRVTEVLPKTDATQLEKVVGEATRVFRLAFQGSVRIEDDLAPTPPVRVDAGKVHQLVLNLLENASDAAGERGGCVRVGTRTSDDELHALLVVSDDGPGIPPAVQAQMWNPLFTTKGHGTGLGLAIVQRLVEEHGATIECRSAPGRGTTFTVAFPRVQQRLEAAPGDAGKR